MKSLREALEFISHREWCLALVLLAVWSCARPYMGFTHDAKMYSLQVVNAATDGAYAEDLFFKYGSQDSFSLFSKLLAPVVSTLGVETAFFTIYLLTSSRMNEKHAIELG